ncbi:ParB family protein [Motilimonas pumila]|uniref:ParB/RepB/Spo0J family partition protein n=1 Tax=Motilimonas pumila TaxID=2303987 RepID=A0A418YA32_9GAMM|nr:ParB family protein [Motilimonas pumila]RJG38788.1 ParB/RepB/Spo0J family partition protein [Motilimonas pumila]
MAKRRDKNRSPVETMPGGMEAVKHASKDELDSLAKRIGQKAEQLNISAQEYLADKFAISTTESHEWTLKSHKKVVLTKAHIPFERLADDTYVNEQLNGRDQSGLTPESLKEIRRTIKMQQFFPAIGYIDEAGKINTLDGSRRRKACLLEQVGLDYLIADEAISHEDAKQLARDIQTAKEHNLRELGIELLLLKESGLEQKEIAKQKGLSAAKVTRALQAASVPSAMIAVFPDYSLLSHPEYRLLLNISKDLESKSLPLSGLVEEVFNEREKLDLSLSNEEIKEALLKLFTDFSKSMLSKPKLKKAVVTELAQFNKANQFARKKVKDDTFSYEFRRMNKEVQLALDEAIAEVLAQHQEQF